MSLTNDLHTLYYSRHPERAGRPPDRDELFDLLLELLDELLPAEREPVITSSNTIEIENFLLP